MKVSELGELGLIDLLARMVAEATRPVHQKERPFPLLVGIGDDAAAWRSREATELFTTDTLVEGVHFLPDKASWWELGWKAMAVNLSDIAAMGGTPLYALVTLALSDDTEVEAIQECYQGMFEACRQYDAAIVGGDVVRSPTLLLTVALTGVTWGSPLLRSKAAPGDLVAVTGTLGNSAGGLQTLLRGLPLHPRAARTLRDAHLRPIPRIAEGKALAASGVRCAIDVSDGLVDDLAKVCQASAVAATVEAERIPVHPSLKEAFPQEHLQLALSGGEDYELLFTAPPAVMEQAIPQLPAGATIIGKVHPGDPGQVAVVDRHGQSLPISRGGWDHFRR